MSVRKGILSIAVSVIAYSAVAQVKGDDEGILTQRANRRDSIAVSTAVNGWWKASMKNHDARIAWRWEARNAH